MKFIEFEFKLDYFDICPIICPLECQQYTYEYDVSLSDFYFDDLVITEITASPSVQFVDLISNIGGFFGLFVGLSVLSFVELIELAVNITRIIINIKRLRNNQRNVDDNREIYVTTKF